MPLVQEPAPTARPERKQDSAGVSAPPAHRVRIAKEEPQTAQSVRGTLIPMQKAPVSAPHVRQAEYQLHDLPSASNAALASGPSSKQTAARPASTVQFPIIVPTAFCVEMAIAEWCAAHVRTITFS